MTTAALLANTAQLDLNNVRQYLIQDLFDSDSDSDDEEQQEDSMAGPSRLPEAAREHLSDNARIGGLRTEVDEPSSRLRGADVEEEDVEEYEMATRKQTTTKPPLSEEEEKEVPPDALQSDRSIQDSLSGELLRMAGILKANSMAFADALERDRKILEEAGEKLQGNLTLMTRTRGKLGEYSKKARGMGWATLASVAVVCISWVVMFILIRLT